LRPPAAQSALQQPLYKTWQRFGLLAIGPAGAMMTLFIIGMGSGGCSLSRTEGAFARMDDTDLTGSIGARQAQDPVPTESDVAFARNAASDVLTRGDRDSSQPWQNPTTGARGSVTPLAEPYSADGRTCRDFLASYVNGRSEHWLQGAGCRTGQGQWEIHTLKPWSES
jgi:surface antigen